MRNFHRPCQAIISYMLKNGLPVNREGTQESPINNFTEENFFTVTKKIMKVHCIRKISTNLNSPITMEHTKLSMGDFFIKNTKGLLCGVAILS